MATINKSTLPLKPSVNPKIATTILAKPIVQKTPVSKTSTSVTVKKPVSVAAKTISEKVMAVKSATTLKGTSKSVTPPSPVKTARKSSVPSANAVKMTNPVRSAADSTTSTLKSKPAIKASIKTPISSFKPTPLTKSVTVSRAVKPASGSEVKKPPVTTVKSAGLLKPKVVEKSIVSKTNSPTIKKTLPLKPSAVSTPVSPRSVTPTTKMSIANKTPSTPTKTSIKPTSQPLSKSAAKPLIGSKTPLKSSTAAKSITTKKVPASPTSKSIVRTAVTNVIKRLQDESEIEIRDADSTTTVEEERNDDVCVPNDVDSIKLCKCDENGNFEQQESEVDEQRVYAVAEQLIGVMQPEELEVITRHVAEQQNNDSCVIDMSAVETEEVSADRMSTSLQELSDEETTTPDVDVEKLEGQYLPNEIVSAPGEEQKIFEMYEMRIQEITDSYRGLNDEPIIPKDVAECIRTDESFKGCEQDCEFSETVADECEDECCTEMSLLDSSPTIIEDVNESRELSPFSDNAETSQYSTEMVVENENELEITLENTICNADESVLNDFVEHEALEDTYSEPAECVEETTEMNAVNEENEDIENQECETENPQLVAISYERKTEFSSLGTNDDSREVTELVDANENLPLTETDEHSIISVDVPELINLESDDDDELADNNNETIHVDESITSCLDVPFTTTDVSHSSFVVEPETEDGLPEVEDEKSSLRVCEPVDSMADMSYAEVVLSAKISTSDSYENGEERVNIADEEGQYPLEDAEDDSVSPIEIDETSEPIPKITAIDTVVNPIPIYSVYDNNEFPDAIPSDEHYEKHEHDHEADQHDESFHKIRHKRTKRRNKKNRKSSNTENFDEQTAPKNVLSERPNYQTNYHGKRRNSRRGWRNSQSYYEAFHQHQQTPNQEYYADPHWKYTPRMD